MIVYHVIRNEEKRESKCHTQRRARQISSRICAQGDKAVIIPGDRNATEQEILRSVHTQYPSPLKLKV